MNAPMYPVTDLIVASHASGTLGPREFAEAFSALLQSLSPKFRDLRSNPRTAHRGVGERRALFEGCDRRLQLSLSKVDSEQGV